MLQAVPPRGDMAWTHRSPCATTHKPLSNTQHLIVTSSLFRAADVGLLSSGLPDGPLPPADLQSTGTVCTRRAALPANAGLRVCR